MHSVARPHSSLGAQLPSAVLDDDTDWAATAPALARSLSVIRMVEAEASVFEVGAVYGQH